MNLFVTRLFVKKLLSISVIEKYLIATKSYGHLIILEYKIKPAIYKEIVLPIILLHGFNHVGCPIRCN